MTSPYHEPGEGFPRLLGVGRVPRVSDNWLPWKGMGEEEGFDVGKHDV